MKTPQLPVCAFDEVCDSIRSAGGGTARSLAKRLGVAKSDFKAFTEGLRRLQAEGLIIRVPTESSGKWELPERTPLRVGRLQFDRRGSGFFRPVDRQEDELFVHSSKIADAFPGDLVLVRMTSRARGDRLGEGRVIEVIERGKKPVRGTYWQGKDGGLVACDDPRMPSDVFIPKEGKENIKAGQRVLVRLSKGSRGRFPHGEIILILTNEDSLEADFAVVQAEFDLPIGHPDGVVDEAAALPAVEDGAAWPDRTDLRDLPTITIDPRDARDFDDAVSLETLDGDRLRLGVHIADVSAYVQPGSLIDQSAESRGTSIYLPGRVIPMLPERLANDLCSLRPEEDRLAKSVFMVFSSEGKLIETEICRSVIRSKRRFTYGEALAILDSLEGRDVPAGDLPPDRADYEPILERMAFLRDCLKDARTRRGALFLDLPQLKIRVGENGQVESVDREQGDPAHSLIEEFMLAANEAVARYLQEQGLSTLARVHPAPSEEKLADFREMLQALGLDLRPRPEVGDLQKLVDKVAGGPLAVTVQVGLLRTMGHAEYTAQPDLHFALSTTSYCHFTSPIRRYSDLLVHRALIRGGGFGDDGLRDEEADRLAATCEHISNTERRAMVAERDANDRYMAAFMAEHTGAEFEARVNGVTRAGLFLTLVETGADGLLPMRYLHDDYYQFDEAQKALIGERSGTRYRLGDSFTVRLVEVNTLTGGLIFELPTETAATTEGARGRPRIGAPRKDRPKRGGAGKHSKRKGRRRS